MDSFLQTDLPAIVWASFLAVVVGLYLLKIGRKGSREGRRLLARLFIGLWRTVKLLLAILLIVLGVSSFFAGRELQQFPTLGERSVVSVIQVWWLRPDSLGGQTMLSVSRHDDPLAQANELVPLPSKHWAVRAHIIRWPDWCSILGFVPIYRISEILLWKNPDLAEPDSSHVFMYSRMNSWQHILDYGKYFDGFSLEYMNSKRVTTSEGVIYRVAMSSNGIEVNEEYTKTVPLPSEPLEKSS